MASMPWVGFDVNKTTKAPLYGKCKRCVAHTSHNKKQKRRPDAMNSVLCTSAAMCIYYATYIADADSWPKGYKRKLAATVLHVQIRAKIKCTVMDNNSEQPFITGALLTNLVSDPPHAAESDWENPVGQLQNLS